MEYYLSDRVIPCCALPESDETDESLTIPARIGKSVPAVSKFKSLQCRDATPNHRYRIND